MERHAQRPAGAEIREAIEAFVELADLQLDFLKPRGWEAASYVGRRLDHAWRRLDHLAGVWIEGPYGEAADGAAAPDIGDIDAAIARAASLPPIEPAEMAEKPQAAARRSIRAATMMARELAECLAPAEPRVRDAAVALHLARRAFSAYRFSKYRWLEQERAAGRYAPMAAYRWLEA